MPTLEYSQLHPIFVRRVAGRAQRNNATSTSNHHSPSTTDYEDGDDNEAECGECGRPLGPGWQCETCRRNCPHCNRALTTDPNDYCERCFRKCDKHDTVYSTVEQGEQEPKCPECRKEQA